MTLQIEIRRVSQGIGSEADTLGPKDVSTHPERSCTFATLDMSSAQFQGVCEYLACIKAGTNTASVETAVAAL